MGDAREFEDSEARSSRKSRDAKIKELEKIQRFEDIQGSAEDSRELEVRGLELPEVIWRWEFSRGVVKLSLRPTYHASRQFRSRLIRDVERDERFFPLYTIPSYIAMWVTVIRGFYEQESPHRVAFIVTLSRGTGMYEVFHVDKRDIDPYFHYKKISIFNKISESALFLRYLIFHVLQRYSIANNYHLFFFIEHFAMCSIK